MWICYIIVTFIKSHGMKQNRLAIVGIFVAILSVGACSDSVWNELPRPIAQFVAKYFPFGDVVTYSTSKDGNTTVEIKNGATVVFNKEYVWVDVNGNGSVLPQMFLFDQLPEPLYNYLQEMESVADVYRVTKNDDMEKVLLTDTYVEYNIKSGRITYPVAS